MANLIPNEFIAQLLDRVDIVDVINKRVPLKKTGRNYMACCPFHNEKTPSFSVSPDKQFYHCFGCGASGDAINFVREFERMEFSEAVNSLAQEAGLEVPQAQETNQSRAFESHKPLYDLLTAASEYYQLMLREHPQNQQAISYFQKRGISGHAAKHFDLGFAPPGWQNLLEALQADKSKHIDTLTSRLIKTGMLVENDNKRQYDRFRHRIMFPIRNVKGQVIAFGGRVLNDEKPKYLNSPETPVFQKGNELYGLYEARKVRQTLTRLILVEGYMDVIGLAQHGIHYAVATLGTATSDVHLKRIFKMVPEVIFCFDGDAAGRKAAERAMETCLPLLEDGLQARFLFLPDGEDPDSLVSKEGKEAFENRLNQCPHLPEFLIAHTKEQVDFDTIDGKARFDQLIAPLVNKLPAGMLRELVEDEIGKQLGRKSVALEKLKQQPNQPAPATTRVASSPQPKQVRPQEEAGLSLAVEKALLALLESPPLAQDVGELPEIVPENKYEQLLLDMLTKLKQQPQKNTVSVLIQYGGTEHHEFLRQLAAKLDDKIPRSLSDLLAPLNNLRAQRLKIELDGLKAKDNQTTEDVRRISELVKLIRQARPKGRQTEIFKSKT